MGAKGYFFCKLLFIYLKSYNNIITHMALMNNFQTPSNALLRDIILGILQKFWEKPYIQDAAHLFFT